MRLIHRGWINPWRHLADLIRIPFRSFLLVVFEQPLPRNGTFLPFLRQSKHSCHAQRATSRHGRNNPKDPARLQKDWLGFPGFSPKSDFGTHPDWWGFHKGHLCERASSRIKAHSVDECLHHDTVSVRINMLALVVVSMGLQPSTLRVLPSCCPR